ncbi:MAG TPA: SDR family NAD(P)-dependent oxidoreductase [Candidatus Binatia bacterium]|jgi:NAD(P)-dependent dehydrogenase (short-subunit alcohol dehydrogenase family)
MAGLLAGKVALITGASSGIGKAVAKRFLEEGAKVAIMDSSEKRLAGLTEELGKDALTVHGDVRKIEDNEKAVAATVEAFGPLNIFVGNAGVFDGFKSLADIATSEIAAAYEQVFDVNVKGYLLGAKATMPELLKTHGNMVFTASIAGLRPNGGGPIYTASKHAVVGLIRQLASDLAPHIRVNGVAPGGTLTDFQAAPALGAVPAFPDKQSAEERMRQNNPLAMALRPEDHTGVYALLASDQARAMTGVVIESDGGAGVRRRR